MGVESQEGSIYMTEDQCKKIQVATAARIYVFFNAFFGGAGWKEQEA